MNQKPEQRAAVGQLHYRVATADDAVLLQRLVQDSFRHPGTSFKDATGAMAQFSIPLDRMLDKITLPDSTVIVVSESSATQTADRCLPTTTTTTTTTTTATASATNTADAAVVVVVACYQVRRKSPTVARFATFAVDARHQGRGLARPIVQHAEDRCRRLWGTTTMQLNTLSSRGGLLDWYRRRGYRETGEREPCPWSAAATAAAASGDHHDEDALHFIVMEKDLEAATAAADL
ncbi:acetyltransferase (GNAT) family domain-containing protein [Cordyceps javanica]|uniref:Acetyltransferase (GNAT) family domain-containing protein n=1 Tax=Cordyceps javanica TaxID=43265 RepID=A0A545VD25_9HYPO|nr:acetyltransferase (GNAT) family domain-containing protein [Cordyceps javanica]TQW10805.1 acetyltransferase (GNAT) family domain-containing protein [Cordyceps javanica]